MTDVFRWHGGRLAQARAHYGGSAEPWIDLSTGINPQPWTGTAHNTPDWHALPDPAALADLESAAARHFGTDAAHVCALPGSEIGLRLLGTLLDRPGCHLIPSYRTHAAAFPKSLPLLASEDAPPGTALLLANPNNPDGRLFPRAHMQALLAHQEGRDGWLIVDEAFADCLPEASIASEVAQDRRLIILRSFGKFFGLAGLRLGFLIAPPAIIAACRQTLGDWPLSAAAIDFGRAAYRDRAWIDQAVTTLHGRATQLDQLLARHGLETQGDCPLFRLVETPNAAALFDTLARQAILTRPFEDQPNWLRFGLPADAAAMARLDAALG
jgi:cobalamin biosynthesis protein CobC